MSRFALLTALTLASCVLAPGEWGDAPDAPDAPDAEPPRQLADDMGGARCGTMAIVDGTLNAGTTDAGVWRLDLVG